MQENESGCAKHEDLTGRDEYWVRNMQPPLQKFNALKFI